MIRLTSILDNDVYLAADSICQLSSIKAGPHIGGTDIMFKHGRGWLEVREPVEYVARTVEDELAGYAKLDYEYI
jgi:hypothetical protein